MSTAIQSCSLSVCTKIILLRVEGRKIGLIDYIVKKFLIVIIGGENYSCLRFSVGFIIGFSEKFLPNQISINNMFIHTYILAESVLLNSMQAPWPEI